MAPLAAFCAFDALFFPHLPLVYSPEQYKHSASLSECHSSVYMRLLGSSQSLVSDDDDSSAPLYLHLVFTTRNWNICVCRTALSLLQQNFARRIPLISSLFLLYVFCKLIFVRRARQNSRRSFWECCFVGQRCLAQGWCQRAEQQQWCLWGTRRDCWLGSVDLRR